MSDLAGPASSTLPTSCLHCGYEIGRIGTAVCPECGCRLLEGQGLIAQRRDVLREEYPSVMRRHVLSFIGVALACSIGFGVVTMSLDAGLSVAMVLGVVLGVSMIFGFIVSLPAAPHERFVVRIAWMRALWWMHGPWLIIVPAGVIALCVAGIERAMAPGSELTETACKFGLAIWVLGWIGCMMRSVVVFSRVLEWCGVPPGAHPGEWGKPGLLSVPLMIITLVASGIVGFAGGVGMTAISLGEGEFWQAF
jgi:hypothetical protein